MRQVHHWAALVFAAAVVVHLLRMFFTGAYRRPRRLNCLLGAALLQLVLGNGVFGYSLPDDLLSGIGLRIAYSITVSIPFIGPWLASVIFGGQFPNERPHLPPLPGPHLPAARAHRRACSRPTSASSGSSATPSSRGRAGRAHHRGHAARPGLRPAHHRLPGADLRRAVALMGGFLQINPVWLFGPYDAWERDDDGAAGLVHDMAGGGLRMFPGWDLQIGASCCPGIFWPAVVLPGVVFTFLFLWPWIDGRADPRQSLPQPAHAGPRAPRPARPRSRPVHGAVRAAARRRDDVYAVAFNADVQTRCTCSRASRWPCPSSWRCSSSCGCSTARRPAAAGRAGRTLASRDGAATERQS